MLGVLLRRLYDCVYFVCGEGTWRLRPHESQVIAAVIDSLPVDKREMVQRQLARSFFVVRMLRGRINTLHYYEGDASLAISDADFADCLFKVRLELNSAGQTAHVTFYEGRLFGVEFKKPGRFFARKQISIREVARGRPKDSYTRVIDRSEHGTTSARGEREDREMD